MFYFFMSHRFLFQAMNNRKNDDTNNKSKYVVEVVGFSTSFAIPYTFCSTFESIVLQINLRHLNPSQLYSLFEWWAFGAEWIKIAPFISINCLLLGQLVVFARACEINTYVYMRDSQWKFISNAIYIRLVFAKFITCSNIPSNTRAHRFYLRIPIHFYLIILHFWFAWGGIFVLQERGLNRCHCTQFAFFVSMYFHQIEDWTRGKIPIQWICCTFISNRR